MKHRSTPVLTLLRLLALTAALGFVSARADEYSDISQLLRAGKLTEAMAKVDVYLNAKPRDPQLRFYKGVIQRDSGRPNDAITTFTKLTEDYPELPEPYNNLAVLYASQNQFDKARAALEMAIRTNPSYSTAHENLGDVYAMLASQAYNKALQLDKGNAAVPPKLALIRELFSPNAKGARPAAFAAPAAPTPSQAPVPAPAPAPVAPAKPPAPLPAPPPPAPPAPPAPATPPAPVPGPTAPTSAVAAANKPAPVVAPVPATPAAPAAPAPAKPAAELAAISEVEGAVAAWAKAWSAKDMAAYLAAYSKEFSPAGKQSFSEWEAERRKRISGKSRISLKLDNLTVNVSGSRATANFRQEYRADSLAVSSRKTLELVRTGDRWLIVRESTGS